MAPKRRRKAKAPKAKAQALPQTLPQGPLRLLSDDLVGRVLDWTSVAQTLRSGAAAKCFQRAIAYKQHLNADDCLERLDAVLVRCSGARILEADLGRDYELVAEAVDALEMHAPGLEEIHFRVYAAWLDDDDEEHDGCGLVFLASGVRALAAAVRETLTGLADCSLDFYDDKRPLRSPFGEAVPRSVSDAVFQLFSALPDRTAVRSGLFWGVGAEYILETVDASDGFDLNFTDAHTDPCSLCWANSPKRDQVPLLAELVARGMSLEATGPVGNRTALGVAALCRNLRYVRALLDAGADPDGGSPTPLLTVCGATLMDADGAERGSGYFHDLESSRSCNSQLRIIDELLRRGADPFATYDGHCAADFMTSWIGSKQCMVRVWADRSYSSSDAHYSESREQFRDDDSDDEEYEDFHTDYVLKRLRGQTRLISDSNHCSELQEGLALLVRAMHQIHLRGRYPPLGLLGDAFADVDTDNEEYDK
mmetsp:Transcript_22651/g.67968  ORF Transcript_22651/g.67968 Transcript_22651/m.67968 type:complete len:480 (-) Transcript_22651:825-2264(-)